METNPKRFEAFVRTATTDDAAAICAVGRSVFSGAFGHSVQPHELQLFLDKEYSHAEVMKTLTNPSFTTFVACNQQSNDIIGFTVLARNVQQSCIDYLTKTVMLQRIYVDTNCHGKGVGKMLMNRVDELARQEGYEWIWLTSWTENSNGNKVYEKSGYKIVGKDSFDVGGVTQTDHIMLKALS